MINSYYKQRERIEELFFKEGRMLAEDIHLYGKKIKDILGLPMDFFISYLKNKHKLRKTAFVIWQLEIPYL